MWTANASATAVADAAAGRDAIAPGGGVQGRSVLTTLSLGQPTG